jgi:ribosomal protein S18 acetylase RimI-like enzyme
MDNYTWRTDASTVDWDELSELYRIAPLGNRPPDALRTVFGNSMFVRFAYAGDVLVAAGRALADGLDCAYIADLAVHPDHQGHGLGRALINELLTAAREHKKIILYARPSTEGFYTGIGFLPMTTAMAIFQDKERALRIGLVKERLDPQD